MGRESHLLCAAETEVAPLKCFLVLNFNSRIMKDAVSSISENPQPKLSVDVRTILDVSTQFTFSKFIFYDFLIMMRMRTLSLSHTLTHIINPGNGAKTFKHKFINVKRRFARIYALALKSLLGLMPLSISNRIKMVENEFLSLLNFNFKDIFEVLLVQPYFKDINHNMLHSSIASM